MALPEVCPYSPLLLQQGFSGLPEPTVSVAPVVSPGDSSVEEFKQLLGWTWPLSPPIQLYRTVGRFFSSGLPMSPKTCVLEVVPLNSG